MNDFDMFDRVEAQEAFVRRKKMLEEAEQRSKLESEQNAKCDAIAKERTIETNRRQLSAEYERAGVRPPCVNGEGIPTVSLSMLLHLGYRIEEIGGERVLVVPPPAPPPTRRRTYADEGS